MSAPRAVRIVTEVSAVDRPFDYLVTDATSHVAVGDRVRVDFNHRSVRGWVIDESIVTDELKPLTKWLGYGPPRSLLALLEWASERWYSPLSRFLISTTPKRLITALPSAPSAAPLEPSVLRDIPTEEPGVLEMAPTTDPLGLILNAYETTRAFEGSLLVLVPTEAWATRLRGRLEQRGCAVACGDAQWDRMRSGWPVVVGARGAALAPVPRVCGAVIIDADDEAYRSERSPTWDAVTILRERCRRDDAPLWCTSSIPSPALLNRGKFRRSGAVEGGWPRIVVADRRHSDPHEGALANVALNEAHRALVGDVDVAVVVVLQRLGAGRLVACRKCGELARCAECGQGEEEVGEQLACRDHHEFRANFCRSCGATNLRRVRVGVTTLARDVSHQLSQVVTEVTAASNPTLELAKVVVGTEAVWQRVRRSGVVIFADFDQYLLAPRESARRSAIAAVAKAGRLVGSRREGRGVVVVQTRRGDDDVIQALRDANFDAIIEEDVATSKLLGLAPYGAQAEVSGLGAEEFVSELKSFTISVHATPSGFIVRAPDTQSLSYALRNAHRPSAKFRVAVQ
ncbi:MAG: hypothetical protein ABI298_08850 [Acidimicrobiales bacterium]